MVLWQDTVREQFMYLDSASVPMCCSLGVRVVNNLREKIQEKSVE